MALRYLVPALAVAGRAAAQCSAVTTTIQNAGDASALSSCSTFSGSIAIETSTTDNIELNGIQRISGSLLATNVSQLTSISADSLQTIDDSFSLLDLQLLSTLNFPQLSAVDTVDWEGLPALQGLSFTTGLQEASTLSIQNTGLYTLDGINLQEIDNLMIANNVYLNEVSMQLGHVSTALNIEANGREVHASFPNLEWAYNMTFRNCSTVEIPSLASLNGSLGFYSNYFTSLSAPNLTNVGGGNTPGSLSFVSNEDLTNVSMPQLTRVNGGLQVANNTEYDDIAAFPALQTVTGALDFNGNFSSVELPAIEDIRGAFNLQSSEDITDACNHFKPLSGDTSSVIKGTYTCAGLRQRPGGTGTLDPGTNAGSGGGAASASSSSSASAVTITGATGLMGVVAAIFGLL